MKSGFGGKQGLISSRSIGKLGIIDRAGSKHGLIRSIGGTDILAWIDATKVSNPLNSALTNGTINNVAGTAAIVGTNPPTTIFSTALNSTAYSFFTNQTLKWNTNFFPANQQKATIVCCFAIPGTLTNHIIFEIGDTGYSNFAGGIVQGAIQNPSDGNNTSYWSGIGDPGAADTFFLNVRLQQNKKTCMISTYDTTTNPDAIKVAVDGEILPPAGQLNQDTTHSILRTNPAYLGARNNGSIPAYPLNGHISDFIVITRLLTNAESQRLSKALNQ